MPIRADLRHFYRGPAWKATRDRIMKRAKNRCEQCGKPNGEAIETYTGHSFLSPRMFWRAAGGPWRDQSGRGVIVKTRADAPVMVGSGVVYIGGPHKPPRTIRVKVGVAHLDHNPENNADENLKALCDWCHLNYDKLHHRETRATRKDAARPIKWEGAITV